MSVFIRCSDWASRIVLLFSVLLSLNVHSGPQREFQFLPESQQLSRLALLEQQAVAEQKLLLVVLGASWCHDSMALLEKFNEAGMAGALNQRYHLAFVDVGYLQAGSATMARYQQPIYYGTPTVMIIEPGRRQLMNKADLMHWTNAASLPLAEYQQYFLTEHVVQQFAKEQQQSAIISAEVQQQIRQFEQQQAATLAQAYLQLGPLLKAYKESGKPAAAEFKESWDTVKAFRTAILPQVAKLQLQATTLVPGEQLVLPAVTTKPLLTVITAKP